MRYICRDYFQRTVCSGRFVLLVLLVWISLCSFFREFVEQLSEMHCRVGALEIFPAWAFCGGGVSTYFILFIFLILAWSGEPSGQAGQKNVAVIAVLLCHYDIGDLLFGCYRWFYYCFISSGGLEKQMEQFLLESK